MLRPLVLCLALAVCPAPAGAQSFTSIFTQLPRDFSRLAQPTSLVILGTAGAASLAVHPHDDNVAQQVNEADGFFQAGDLLGEGAVHAAAGFAVYLSGRALRNTDVGRLGSDLLRAQIVSGVITDGLKLATNRTRPDGGKYSFPSGHAASAFASAAVLHHHFGWKAGVPSYAIASYVATSRVAYDRHFLSDVVFGAGIGLASSFATTFHLRDTSIDVTPALTLSSAAFNITIRN